MMEANLARKCVNRQIIKYEWRLGRVKRADCSRDSRVEHPLVGEQVMPAFMSYSGVTVLSISLPKREERELHELQARRFCST